MTNTDTADIGATVKQVYDWRRLVPNWWRITVNTPEAAAAVPAIRKRRRVRLLRAIGSATFTTMDTVCSPIPGVRAVAGKIPHQSRQRRTQPRGGYPFTIMIETAVRYGKPVRIGVNWGQSGSAAGVRMMDENSRLPQPKDVKEVTRAALIASAWRVHNAPNSSACRMTASCCPARSARWQGSDRRCIAR